ncbi:hypothetical protein HNQ50_001808 [Silvimonas terrae]|uniref:Uncharacterized protein n=1 Tax=Silvimonas terrae TaxID=300266 RepID=A0A840RCK9_9NEIS|nr:hypothetical protein [Silvimonas terrae]MBB5191085.1 hypothetical protein [Silvimonas terrae]
MFRLLDGFEVSFLPFVLATGAQVPLQARAIIIGLGIPLSWRRSWRWIAVVEHRLLADARRMTGQYRQILASPGALGSMPYGVG